MFRSFCLAAARPRWPRRLLVLAAAALIPVLAGCEAGNNAPTQEWHQPTDGAGTVFRNIAIRNVFILGAPIGQSLPKGGEAGLFLALVNDGSADTLTSISAPGTAASVSLPGGAVTLAPQQGVFLTGPSPKVVLHDLTRTVTGGSVVTLHLTFQKAGSITMQVPVMPRAQYYATFAPPAPSPSATPSAVSATPGPSASPSASAAASPTPAP